MKQLLLNKNWKFNEEYDINHMLYLLIDRPNYIFYFQSGNDFIWKNNKFEWYRGYDLPTYMGCDGYISWRYKHTFIKGITNEIFD